MVAASHKRLLRLHWRMEVAVAPIRLDQVLVVHQVMLPAVLKAIRVHEWAPLRMIAYEDREVLADCDFLPLDDHILNDCGMSYARMPLAVQVVVVALDHRPVALELVPVPVPQEEVLKAQDIATTVNRLCATMRRPLCLRSM